MRPFPEDKKKRMTNRTKDERDQESKVQARAVKEIINAIAPHGLHSAKKRLNRMGCMRYVTLPNGALTFNVRSHQWDGVRITPRPAVGYTMKLWRAFRVPDLRNRRYERYREETHHLPTLKELRRKFNEAFLETRFRALVQTCNEELERHSSPELLARSPAYGEILSMGSRAIPLLLEELRDKGGIWHAALRTLTGAQPVPRIYRSNPALTTTAWLQWGRENGHLDPRTGGDASTGGDPH